MDNNFDVIDNLSTVNLNNYKRPSFIHRIDQLTMLRIIPLWNEYSRNCSIKILFYILLIT